MDQYALNQMINNKDYEYLKSNLNFANKFCKEKNIQLCFLYSRLAHDNIIKYNSREYLIIENQFNKNKLVLYFKLNVLIILSLT